MFSNKYEMRSKLQIQHEFLYTQQPMCVFINAERKALSYLARLGLVGPSGEESSISKDGERRGSPFFPGNCLKSYKHILLFEFKLCIHTHTYVYTYIFKMKFKKQQCGSPGKRPRK